MSQFPNSIKIAFSSGGEDTIQNIRLLEVDGKPYSPPDEVDEAIESIKSILIEQQTRIDMLERMLTAVVAPAGAQTPDSADGL